MHFVHHDTLSTLLSSYGYVAIFAVILLESAGVPMPGETILIAASIYAGSRDGLDIRLVIAAAATAAILGDNLGYWVGRRFGEPLLERFGPTIGLDSRKQMLGQFLFKSYGGPIVFFGRFVALLRTYSALLAGVNRLAFPTFFAWNATGGIVWASLFGAGGYLLGHGIEAVSGPIGWVALACAGVGAVVMWRFYRVHEDRLLDQAEREMGPRRKH